MQIKVVYFASVREQMGEAEQSLEVPDTVHTVADFTAWLTKHHDSFSTMTQATPQLLIAVNHSTAQADTTLHSGDEIAFFPPVTGG